MSTTKPNRPARHPARHPFIEGRNVILIDGLPVQIIVAKMPNRYGEFDDDKRTIRLDSGSVANRRIIPVLLHEINHALESHRNLNYFTPIGDCGEAHEFSLNDYAYKLFNVCADNKFCFNPEHYPAGERKRW
jgi:hypothetical protein